MRSRRPTGIARLAELLAGAVLLAVLALLRPPMPDFGPSLKTPLTTSTLTRLAVLLLWGVCMLLALALLQRALMPARTLTPPAWATGTGARRRRRAHQLSRRDTVLAPRLLVPSRGTDTADLSNRAHDAAADTATVATIRLLGPVEIDGIRRPRRAGTTELLAYLALHPDGASRDQLLEALWPGEDPRRTRPRLWHAVSEARRLLGDTFEHDGDRYKLDRTHVAIDADDLERLLPRIDAAAAEDLGPLVERALALWRGQPLGGADYAWASGHIRRLEATFSKIAEMAAGIRLDARDAQGALEIAEQGLSFDGLNETFVRIALTAEAALGRRDAVTRRYAEVRRQLDDRLGLEPERATRLLYRQLLGQDGIERS